MAKPESPMMRYLAFAANTLLGVAVPLVTMRLLMMTSWLANTQDAGVVVSNALLGSLAGYLKKEPTGVALVTGGIGVAYARRSMVADLAADLDRIRATLAPPTM